MAPPTPCPTPHGRLTLAASDDVPELAIGSIAWWKGALFYGDDAGEVWKAKPAK